MWHSRGILTGRPWMWTWTVSFCPHSQIYQFAHSGFYVLEQQWKTTIYIIHMRVRLNVFFLTKKDKDFENDFLKKYMNHSRFSAIIAHMLISFPYEYLFQRSWACIHLSLKNIIKEPIKLTGRIKGLLACISTSPFSKHTYYLIFYHYT